MCDKLKVFISCSWFFIVCAISSAEFETSQQHLCGHYASHTVTQKICPVRDALLQMILQIQSNFPTLTQP